MKGNGHQGEHGELKTLTFEYGFTFDCRRL